MIIDNIKDIEPERSSMKKSKTIQHFEKHLSAFRKYLKKTQKNQGVEDIHELRVSIKKLRAILSLLEISSKGQITKKKHYDLFYNLFKSCGKVREAQVNLELVSKFENMVHLHPYFDFLTNEQRKGNKQMSRELEKFSLVKLNSLNRPIRRIMRRYSDEVIMQEAATSILKKN